MNQDSFLPSVKAFVGRKNRIDGLGLGYYDAAKGVLNNSRDQGHKMQLYPQSFIKSHSDIQDRRVLLARAYKEDLIKAYQEKIQKDQQQKSRKLNNGSPYSNFYSSKPLTQSPEYQYNTSWPYNSPQPNISIPIQSFSVNKPEYYSPQLDNPQNTHQIPYFTNKTPQNIFANSNSAAFPWLKPDDGKLKQQKLKEQWIKSIENQIKEKNQIKNQIQAHKIVKERLEEQKIEKDLKELQIKYAQEIIDESGVVPEEFDKEFRGFYNKSNDFYHKYQTEVNSNQLEFKKTFKPDPFAYKASNKIAETIKNTVNENKFNKKSDLKRFDIEDKRKLYDIRFQVSELIKQLKIQTRPISRVLNDFSPIKFA